MGRNGDNIAQYYASLEFTELEICSLYNAEDPRFNIIGFTQPDYLFEVARKKPSESQKRGFSGKIISVGIRNYELTLVVHNLMKRDGTLLAGWDGKSK